MEIEYKKPGRQNWERHNGVGVYNHVVGLLEGNPELEFVSLTFRTTGQYDYRRKPQSRYVTKNVQDVRRGNVIKDEGEVLSILHREDDKVILKVGGVFRSYHNTVDVEVELRD